MNESLSKAVSLHRLPCSWVVRSLSLVKESLATEISILFPLSSLFAFIWCSYLYNLANDKLCFLTSNKVPEENLITKYILMSCPFSAIFRTVCVSPRYI